jgi:hypothetical protein
MQLNQRVLTSLAPVCLGVGGMVVLPQVYSIPVFAQATPALEQDLEALREEGEVTPDFRTQG